MSERLIHYSATGVRTLYSECNRDNTAYKPFGFWVSVEGQDDWHSWCTGEGFREEHLAYPHEVQLSASANILRLRGTADLSNFQDSYGVKGNLCFNSTRINWGAVSGDYQGIIIAPYVWSQRTNMMWYYGWDCASGCIWDVSAIESVTPLYEKERITA